MIDFTFFLLYKESSEFIEKIIKLNETIRNNALCLQAAVKWIVVRENSGVLLRNVNSILNFNS